MPPSEEELGALLNGVRRAGDAVAERLGRREDLIVVAALRAVQGNVRPTRRGCANAHMRMHNTSNAHGISWCWVGQCPTSKEAGVSRLPGKIPDSA